MVRLFALVVLAFKAWMFLDAVRRDAESRWFWVIPFVPGGALIYFVVVKLREPGMQLMKQRMLEQLKRPQSVEELESRFRRTPSLQNRTTLGQGLFDAERYHEALSHFEEVLAQRADDKDGLYGVALCKLELGEAAAAIDPLSALIEAQPSYRDYAAWGELAEALWQSGEREASLELLADLVKTAPRLRHCLLQATFLRRAGEHDAAARLLREALEEEQHQPRHTRRLSRPWQRRAKKMLHEMAQAS